MIRRLCNAPRILHRSLLGLLSLATTTSYAPHFFVKHCFLFSYLSPTIQIRPHHSALANNFELMHTLASAAVALGAPKKQRVFASCSSLLQYLANESEYYLFSHFLLCVSSLEWVSNVGPANMCIVNTNTHVFRWTFVTPSSQHVAMIVYLMSKRLCWCNGNHDVSYLLINRVHSRFAYSVVRAREMRAGKFQITQPYSTCTVPVHVLYVACDRNRRAPEGPPPASKEL